MLGDSKEQRKYFCHLLIKFSNHQKISYPSYLTIGSLNLFNTSFQVMVNQEFKALGGKYQSVA